LKPLKVGLVGLGTVGTGVAKILIEGSTWLTRRTGVPIQLKRIVDIDTDRDRGIPLDDVLLSSSAEDILNDPEISVMIELIGGIEPARSFLLEAMAKKKHVVTANKALLASHGTELFRAALEAGVQIGFEASVAGGIPIVRCIKEGLAADRIQSIAGIINGTANYILSSMTARGLEFSECLKEAQDNGYAEADPALDINGKDTVHKLSILVALAHGFQVHPDAIYTEGIQHISRMDIGYAEKLGYRIKLLALSKVREGELEARVHPTMIPENHMLAKVDQAFNAVYLTGEDTGPVMFFGKGAGMMPTGSAVVSDLIEVARNQCLGRQSNLPPLGYFGEFPQEASLKPMEALVAKYYIRFPVVDRPGVLSTISGILGKHDISILSVIQQGREESGPVQVIMLSHEAREEGMQKALEEINRLEVVLDKGLFIRIEDTIQDNV